MGQVNAVVKPCSTIDGGGVNMPQPGAHNAANQYPDQTIPDGIRFRLRRCASRPANQSGTLTLKSCHNNG
jgi:hypothetical protein